MELKYFFSFLVQFINLFRWLLLARILLSWFPSIKWYDQPWRFINDVTEPALAPFRRLIPPLGGVVDVSPMVLFFALNMLASVLSGLAR
jgi:YggT family protein